MGHHRLDQLLQGVANASAVASFGQVVRSLDAFVIRDRTPGLAVQVLRSAFYIRVRFVGGGSGGSPCSTLQAGARRAIRPKPAR